MITDSDTPVKQKEIGDPKTVSSFLRLVWNQTAPLFMSKHIRKTLLAAIIQFIIFFTAHGVYMWFPYILNNAMLYTQNYDEPLCLCDILTFTQSSNFTTQYSLEPFQV